MPIIILSVRGEERDVFRGLELGADDYIIKPFRQLELLARIRAVIRRKGQPEKQQPISCGALRISPEENTVELGDRRVGLTHTECRLLTLLMENPGITLSHAKIAEHLWGDEFVDSRSCIKVYIGRLRQKLEQDPRSPDTS
jgi:two-component system KDP operon response regulator KdpE